MENRDVSRVLRETASLLEIDGAIIGRYRSYERAAELLDSLPESIAEIAATPERLEELPGIGERMAEHIQEILKTGDYSLRKKLLKKYPATILDLLTLQSLGAKLRKLTRGGQVKNDDRGRFLYRLFILSTSGHVSQFPGLCQYFSDRKRGCEKLVPSGFDPGQKRFDSG